MADRFEMQIAANALLLLNIPNDREILIRELVHNLNEECVRIRETITDFDFGYWASGTVPEVIGALESCNLLQVNNVPREELLSTQEWLCASVISTDYGTDYLRAAIPMMESLLKQPI